MQTLHYEITIQAPRERVWATMLEQATYRAWTKPFSDSSRYEGSWDEGSRIVFLSDTGQGTAGGMVSRIKANQVHELVTIEHLGMVMDGVEDTTSDDVRQWAPCYETYRFATVAGGATHLSVDVDASPDWAAMFDEAWPKSLARLKQLAEQ